LGRIFNYFDLFSLIYRGRKIKISVDLNIVKREFIKVDIRNIFLS